MNLPKLITISAAVAAGIVVAACGRVSEPVVTFVEPDDPSPVTAEALKAWTDTRKGLHGAWGDPDLRYSRSEVPQPLDCENFEITAWRGERASAQFLLWTADGADGVECRVEDFRSDNATLPASTACTRFVRYTLADSVFRVGGPTILSPDMLDTLSRFDMAPRTVRPVWVTVEVPRDAAAGVYRSQIVATRNGCGKVRMPLTLVVQDHTLPEPAEWSYHLDLWQHPSSVARAQGLDMWGDAHFEAMKPIMTMLAEAGQKVVTATLNKDPWNHQCYDGYENMIEWTRRKDGTWSYNYEVFDRWVEMMFSLGIDKMINCYSMVPWNCELDYFDEAQGKTVTVKAEPGKPEFPAMWEPFLADFKKHLADKGWLGITNIAMDERSPEAMDAAVKVLEKCAPEMGFALADNHKSYKKYTMMRDVCVAQGQPADHADIEARRAQGFNTTFYVCCGPLYPNTFTYSAPFEAELLGWYGLAWDYDGMLRWAYNSWPADPQTDSRYGTWSSGDTYLVYPHARSSIRFERLIDGIEAAEKVRALRAAGVDTSAVEAALAKIRATNVNDHTQPWRQITAEARTALNEVSAK